MRVSAPGQIQCRINSRNSSEGRWGQGLNRPRVGWSLAEVSSDTDHYHTCLSTSTSRVRVLMKRSNHLSRSNIPEQSRYDFICATIRFYDSLGRIYTPIWTTIETNGATCPMLRAENSSSGTYSIICNAR